MRYAYTKISIIGASNFNIRKNYNFNFGSITDQSITKSNPCKMRSKFWNLNFRNQMPPCYGQWPNNFLAILAKTI